MKANVLRIVLDVVMLLLLALMYRVNVVSISFHEIGGLAVCGLFVIHKGLNWKWIVGVSRRHFGATLPAKTRVGYAVDFLLLVCVVLIAVSGIMISRTILTMISGNWLFWTLGHYFSAAVALVLCGVHIGLHWSFISSMFARALRLPRAIARPLGIVCLAAIVAYGGYSTVTSRFTGWLTSPLLTLTPSSAVVFNAFEQDGDAGGQALGAQRGVNTFEFGGVLGVIATYGSVMAVPAVLTVLTESALKRRRRLQLNTRAE